MTFIVKSKKRNEVHHYPITPNARAILEDALKLSVGGSGLVFTTSTGKRIQYRARWLKIKKRANLPKEIRPHDLRHTFASLLASSGEVTLFEVQKLLGHKDIRSTERYAHLADKAMKGRLKSQTQSLGNIG